MSSLGIERFRQSGGVGRGEYHSRRGINAESLSPRQWEVSGLRRAAVHSLIPVRFSVETVRQDAGLGRLEARPTRIFS